MEKQNVLEANTKEVEAAVEGITVGAVEDKKQTFYEQLFAKDPEAPEEPKKKRRERKPKGETPVAGEIKDSEEVDQYQHPERKKQRETFNKQLERIADKKEEEKKKRELKEKEKAKKLKEKQKKAKLMGRKTAKGQPVMKNILAHYLEKIQKGQA